MSLTLKIISPINLPAGQLPEFVFDELGGTIGRKPNNNFVLIDPERFISSQHASIEYQGGKYVITDTSTNGVFINNSKRPIGTGNSQELMNGDKISIGEFQLQAVLSDAVTEDDIWNLQGLPASQPADNLFDFNEPLIQDNGSGSLDPMDPLALLGDMPSGSGNQFSPRQNESASEPFISQPSASNALSTELPDDDFFGDLLGNPHQNIPEPLAINEPFTPPSAIPDDWDIMGDNHSGESTNSTAATGPDQLSTSIPMDDIAFENQHFENTLFESTSPIIPEDNSLFDENDIFASLSASAQPMQTETHQTPPPAPSTPHITPPTQQPQINAQPATTPPYQTPVQDDPNELLNAFIRGAGLDPSQIKADNPIEMLTKLGQLTRISTEGLMMALRARATIKSSFRVNKTIIAPIENNPLKFSVTSEDALNIIFADEKTGYMSATEAFSEGFKDLQTHQMAMMAGMQAIIKEITEQFSPVNLERKFEAQKTGSSFIPGNKKAKYWEMYETFYKKMTETLQDDFQNVYGEEFARAYENQIRKLM